MKANKNYFDLVNESFNKKFSKQSRKMGKLLRRNELLSESISDSYFSDFKSDVYNALGDVMFKWYNKDMYPTEEDMDRAYEWFSTHFWDSDDYPEDGFLRMD